MNIEAAMNAVNVRKGNVNAILSKLRSPTKEIKPKDKHTTVIGKFGCEKAIHRLTIKTRMKDKTF
jgi:hypothetical protein